uniref:dual-specificity kinase n=1 Tax=Nothobranchius kuhntae TaxID=321403 RepID=A0A1A8J2T6_NOTKU
MRQSKRMRSPGAWLDEYSWEERMECRKRRKRDSYSSERENRSRRNPHCHKTLEGHYLEARSLNQRLDSQEMYPREHSLDVACDDDSREETHKDRDDWHHYSKSSGRNEIVCTLGEGAFGKVVECIDHSNEGARVALKIIKNIDRYREAALSEVEVLKQLKSLDADNKYACVHMLDWFDYHGHICIVFELLGLSTYDFLKENNFQPFPVKHIRHMAYQIIRAVKFLHKNKLTHTDLKPENILLIDSDYNMAYNRAKRRDERTLKSPDIKIVDFGNATFDHEHHTSVVSTRHYRAPEVILDLGWDHSCDVWSIGCILIEYYLGTTLFQTHDSKEHLAMMERVLGPIPTNLLEKTKKRRYVHRNRLDWDVHSSSGRYVRKHCRPLKHYISSKTEDHRQLFDLIEKMMEYDPTKRLSLEQALHHPFFSCLYKTSNSRKSNSRGSSTRSSSSSSSVGSK